MANGLLVWGRRPRQLLEYNNAQMFDMWSILWNRFHIMQIVQIVLDKKLLRAADQAAKRTRRNRSALVRDALREHLRRLELRASEERDRAGYSRRSQADAEAQGWESEATWPEE
jgi:predicted transcriptional regulator